ncbi:hypothetical protein CSA37_12335 [Candidatus Fermentibacteria bacterium]|nr:MAG: hypothetical protein CSA37_12335 [Candidatus Fermentibacteria bacterium]
MRFAIVFLAALLFVVPGVFDTTAMSRLALYPLVASVVLFAGRKNVSISHFILGMMLAVLPFLSLFWNNSPEAGLPYQVRWASFGIMVTGFSGSVKKSGITGFFPGLAAAAAVTALLIIVLGPDAVTGNPNRAGMILALGFTASLFLLRKEKPYLLALPALILSGTVLTEFYICWIASLAGLAGFLLCKTSSKTWRIILVLMIVGQAAALFFPELAGKAGPTLELRTRIWRNSVRLFGENFPLGTGTGSARIRIFNTSEPELRILAGGNRRVDYLHSEPLTLITENGVFGILTVIAILYLIMRKHSSPEISAMALAFWPVFTSDLPLATPLGALPAALFIGMLTPVSKRKINLPLAVPAVLSLLSLYWCHITLDGYRSFSSHMNTGSLSDIERACRKIPWEERVFLAAGYRHLAEGLFLAAIEDSRHFLQLYPQDSRGWELQALALSAAGRENSSSAWAKAALLLPDETFREDRYLMLINSIDTERMEPDTALMVADAFHRMLERNDDFLPAMPYEEQQTVLTKLIYLTETSLMLGSDNIAAEIWAEAIKISNLSENAPVPEVSIYLLSRTELNEHFTEAIKSSLEDDIAHLREKLGMTANPLPSP